MAQNKLILNSDKTHLLVMTSARMHRNHDNFGIVLHTGTEIIEPRYEERLLGAYLSNDLCWNNHIRDSKSSLMSTLTSRINALCKVCQYANFVTRKNVANGIVMSYFTYLLPLYGGCAEYLLDSLQILQNRADRLATKSTWGTSSALMLLQLGWLNVRQMVVFHSLVLLFKSKKDKKPAYLYNQISGTFHVNTRLAVNDGIKVTRRFTSTLAQQSFLPRSIQQWNLMPGDVRSIPTLDKFKISVKKWVKLNY